jgi:sigma-B regulation protein RsbU (phosphoserine phosphatase)
MRPGSAILAPNDVQATSSGTPGHPWDAARSTDLAGVEHLARMERELLEARAFQQQMLPGAHARVGDCVLFGSYQPCDMLGGDFYDWADAGGGRAAMLIADVSGHGVAAAMLTGFVKAAFQAAHVDGFAPEVIASRVRDGLRGLDCGSFVTLFAGRLDPRRGALEYVSAGHPYAAVRRAGVAAELDLTGVLLTPAFSEVEYAMRQASFPADAQLLLWTDGIEEAVAASGERFGRARLLDVIECGGIGAQLLDDVQAAVQAFIGRRPLRDDCTMVLASTAG